MRVTRTRLAWVMWITFTGGSRRGDSPSHTPWRAGRGGAEVARSTESAATGTPKSEAARESLPGPLYSVSRGQALRPDLEFPSA